MIEPNSRKLDDLRGRSLKLSLPRNTSRIRRTFFRQRVVTDWNRLPQHVIEASSTNAFKTDLTISGNWTSMSI